MPYADLLRYTRALRKLEATASTTTLRDAARDNISAMQSHVDDYEAAVEDLKAQHGEDTIANADPEFLHGLKDLLAQTVTLDVTTVEMRVVAQEDVTTWMLSEISFMIENQ